MFFSGFLLFFYVSEESCRQLLAFTSWTFLDFNKYSTVQALQYILRHCFAWKCGFFFSLPEGGNICFSKLLYTWKKIYFIWFMLSGLDWLFHSLVDQDPLYLVSVKAAQSRQMRRKSESALQTVDIAQEFRRGKQTSSFPSHLLGDGHWGDAG